MDAERIVALRLTVEMARYPYRGLIEECLDAIERLQTVAWFIWGQEGSATFWEPDACKLIGAPRPSETVELAVRNDVGQQLHAIETRLDVIENRFKAADRLDRESVEDFTGGGR